MTIKTTVRGYLNDAARAFDRAPVEVALAFCAALAISYGIEVQVGETAVQFTISALLVAAVAWSATLLHAAGTISERQRWVFTFGGVAGGVAYFLIADLDNNAEMWRALMLLGAGFLLVFAAPSWSKPGVDRNLRLRRVNGRFLLRAIGIGLYGLALFAGLALALVSINNLFELQLKDKIYQHVLTWIMLVLVPWVIVGGLHDYVAPLDQQSDVERAVHRLTHYLVPPLVAIYYLILIAYAIRIAITGELPQNLVSPMVIAAGVLAAIALILFDPDSDTAGGLRWLRFMPAPFVLLAPLGIWALYARVDAYGWTEFRLLRLIVLMALLALALLAVARLIERKRYALPIIPAFLSVVLLASAIGPWSVLSVARRDQQRRLLAALRSARVDPARIPASTDTTRRAVAQRLYAQINSTSAYLASNFGVQALPHESLRRAWRAQPYALAETYHLVSATPDSADRYVSGSLARDVPLKLAGGQTAFRVEYMTARGTPSITHVRGDTLVITLGEMLYAPLTPVLAALRNQAGPDRAAASALPVIQVTDAAGSLRAQLVLFDVSFRRHGGKVEITNLHGLLLLNK